MATLTVKASEQLRANQKVKKLEDELNNLKDEKTLLAEKIAECIFFFV